MGIDHGKRIKAPLGKPKVIDEIRKKGEKYPPDASSPKTKPLKKQTQTQAQTAKPKVRDALNKNKQAKESSNKETMDDSQKRGQVSPRYNLFEGRRLPKEPTKKPKFTKEDYKKFSSPGSKNKRKPRNTEKLPRPTQFLPHIIKPLFMYPEGEKPKFLRKKTSGEA
tara:strand:+ start:195 stop:692 length:498 start_codon:yes stop_codon:yes gene_type:complete